MSDYTSHYRSTKSPKINPKQHPHVPPAAVSEANTILGFLDELEAIELERRAAGCPMGADEFFALLSNLDSASDAHSELN